MAGDRLRESVASPRRAEQPPVKGYRVQPERFDHLTRVLGASKSRREALALLAGGLITAGVGMLWPRRAEGGGNCHEDKGEVFCDNAKKGGATACCATATGRCCGHGGVCCPNEQTCCGDTCCGTGQTCVRGVCKKLCIVGLCAGLDCSCGEGYVCAGKAGCCPKAQACSSYCCPTGVVCLHNRCGGLKLTKFCREGDGRNCRNNQCICLAGTACMEFWRGSHNGECCPVKLICFGKDGINECCAPSQECVSVNVNGTMDNRCRFLPH